MESVGLQEARWPPRKRLQEPHSLHQYLFLPMPGLPNLHSDHHIDYTMSTAE